MKTSPLGPLSLFINNRSIVVPFFQRAYVWEEEQWDRFLDSVEKICDKNESHFMGCLILKQQRRPAGEEIGDVRLLIDGQQRLTTLCILMRLLYEKLDDVEEFKKKFFNRKKEPILHHNHNNIECFNSIMSGMTEEDKGSYIKRKYRGKIEYNDQTFACYEYFKKSDIFKNLKKEFIDRIEDNLSFLEVGLDENEDEQQIFDTINSIGVSLTPAELLKNELFDSESKNLYETTWKSEFEQEDNKSFWDSEIVRRRHNLDLFMQSSLLIFSKERDSKEQGYENIDALFKNYKLYLKNNNIRKGDKKFIKKLMDLARTYRENINIDLLKERIDAKQPIQKLMIPVLGSFNTPVIHYILYVLTKVSDKTERDKMFSLLENYLTRRIVCKNSTKNYNRLFADMIGNDGIHSYDKLRERLLELTGDNEFPSDQSLEEGFAHSKLINRDAQTILYLLDISLGRPERNAVDLCPYKDFSLEHVMPKNWRKNWNEDDIDADNRDYLLLRLGNLAILRPGANGSVKDKAWKDKQEALKEYAAGIKTFDTKEFLHAAKWDESLIEKRALWLYKKALKVWPYPKD